MLSKLAQPALWPVIVYICAYISTTVIGAVAVLTSFGQEQARIFLPEFAPEQMPTLGSPLYLAVLFGPLLVVPAFALIGLRVGDTLWGGGPRLKVADPGTRTLYGLMAIFVGWCLYKLGATGYLIPDFMLDQTKTCADRITRRVELLSQLHFTFYAFAYAALPFVSVMFLVKWIRDHKAADLVGFMASFVVIFYLYASIYMKAPFAIYFLILLVGLLAAGLRWWKVFAVIGAWLSLHSLRTHIALGCTGYGEMSLPTPPPSAAPALQSRQPSAAPVPWRPNRRPSAAPARSQPIPPSPGESPLRHELQLSTRAQLIPLVRNLIFRMALSFPYYMETFKDPAERCGIEDDRIPFIPKQTCFPANKVFSAMYPSVTYVQGQAPASAHVSALAELGPWFAFVVMIAAGLAIGITSQLARHCGPVLRIGVITAVSVFAYNLTQVPFMGALTYSQGFIVFFFPVALIVASRHVLSAFSTAGYLGPSIAPAFAATKSAAGSTKLLWRSAGLRAWKRDGSVAGVPRVIWAGAGATVIVLALVLAGSSIREFVKRVDSNTNAVARYEERLDTEFATMSAALREAATNRQRLESLLQANAQLVKEIANLKREVDALKRARAAPRTASGRWRRRH